MIFSFTYWRDVKGASYSLPFSWKKTHKSIHSASTFEKACWIWAECLEAKSVRQITRPRHPKAIHCCRFGIGESFQKIPGEIWNLNSAQKMSHYGTGFSARTDLSQMIWSCPASASKAFSATAKKPRARKKNDLKKVVGGGDQRCRWIPLFSPWLWGFIVNQIPKTNQQLQKEVPSSLNMNNSTHEKLHTKMYTHSRMIHTRYLVFWYTHCMHIWYIILYVISHTSIYTDSKCVLQETRDCFKDASLE